jgi:hypothetical protein
MTARTHRPNAHDRQRGSALVEAALVIPVLLMVLAGIVDYGTYLAKANDAAAATRAVALVGARAGADVHADWDMLRSVGNQARIGGFTLDRVVVYRVAANQAEGRPPADCLTAAARTAGGVAGVCNVYEKVDVDAVVAETVARDTFARSDCTGWDRFWCPANRSTSADRIGVYVNGAQRMPTGFFGSTRQVQERALYRFDYDPDTP